MNSGLLSGIFSFNGWQKLKAVYNAFRTMKEENDKERLQAEQSWMEAAPAKTDAHTAQDRAVREAIQRSHWAPRRNHPGEDGVCMLMTLGTHQ
jgi:hypothetical protein